MTYESARMISDALSIKAGVSIAAFTLDPIMGTMDDWKVCVNHRYITPLLIEELVKLGKPTFNDDERHPYELTIK